jgi:YggT family protein
VIAAVLLDLTRALVVIALVYAAVVALTFWAVRSKRLSPFGAWPRFVRRISDPVLLRLERRIIGLGASPQNASFWLLGIVIIGGLLLITVVRWLIGFAVTMTVLAQAGPREWLLQAIAGIFFLLRAALIVRVVASWLGASRYSRWMRPVVLLTDWIVEPLRRVLPPFGPLDLSPLVAYFLLWIAERVLIGALL